MIDLAADSLVQGEPGEDADATELEAQELVRGQGIVVLLRGDDDPVGEIIADHLLEVVERTEDREAVHRRT